MLSPMTHMLHLLNRLVNKFYNFTTFNLQVNCHYGIKLSYFDM